MSISSVLLNASAWRAKYFDKASISSRTAVVVGATSGIGEACSHRLAEQGWKVIAVGRHREGRSQQILEALDALSPSSDENKDSATTTASRHEFVACDCFSLKDVQRASKEILAKYDTIDALVLTQGMATTQGFTPTIDGNDEKLTLHYFSRIAFSSMLLPALKKSTLKKGSVVLSVLSGGVHSPYKYYREDFPLKMNYSVPNAANAAGFYKDFGYDVLAEQNPSVNFVHAAPGFINTNWGTEFNPILRTFVRCMQPLFGRKATDCAEFMVGPTIFSSEYGDNLPTKPNESRGVIIMGEKGQPALLTDGHTEEARSFVWDKTVETLKKAGIFLD